MSTMIDLSKCRSTATPSTSVKVLGPWRRRAYSFYDYTQRDLSLTVTPHCDCNPSLKSPCVHVGIEMGIGKAVKANDPMTLLGTLKELRRDRVWSYVSSPQTVLNDSTPLAYAAGKGYYDVVDILLNVPSIDVNQICLGGTPLMHAAVNGHAYVVDRLMKHPDIDVNLTTSQGNTACIYAAAGGHLATVTKILAHESAKALPPVKKPTPLKRNSKKRKSVVIESRHGDVSLVKKVRTAEEKRAMNKKIKKLMQDRNVLAKYYVDVFPDSSAKSIQLVEYLMANKVSTLIDAVAKLADYKLMQGEDTPEARHRYGTAFAVNVINVAIKSRIIPTLPWKDSAIFEAMGHSIGKVRRFRNLIQPYETDFFEYTLANIDMEIRAAHICDTETNTCVV